MDFTFFQLHKTQYRCNMNSEGGNEGDFEASLCQGALYKRKDFLGKEEDAKTHPNRTYYFRKSVDIDQLILSCSNKLSKNPSDRKALLIRAASFAKKQQHEEAIRDYSLLISNNPTCVRACF